MTSRSLRRSLRRGASAIEFALTLPVMITIFSVIVEYGLSLIHISEPTRPY